MKNVKPILISVIIFISSLLVGITTLNTIQNISENIDIDALLLYKKLNDGDIINLGINGNTAVEFKFEVAKSIKKTTGGLMFREKLPANEGMIFLFPSAQPRVFWMKDTLISLDIIFLNRNLEVINIHHSTIPNQLETTYSSTSPSIIVIELPAGTAKRENINPGTQFILLSDIL